MFYLYVWVGCVFLTVSSALRFRRKYLLFKVYITTGLVLGLFTIFEKLYNTYSQARFIKNADATKQKTQKHNLQINIKNIYKMHQPVLCFIWVTNKKRKNITCKKNIKTLHNALALIRLFCTLVRLNSL